MAHDQAYLEAEKEIEEALKSGAMELDLSGLKLTELPESIGQLTQLKKLDLGSNYLKQDKELNSNQLTILPESLGQLIQLEYLDLSGNQLSAIPKWISQLSNLTEFRIYENKLTEIPIWVANLKRLKSLVLTVDRETNRFSQLPDFIQEFSELEELVIEDFKLVSLPPWVGNLTKLKSLYLTNNLLTDLPSSLIQLEKLEDLNLGGNILNPELAEAYQQGMEAIKTYLRARSEGEVVLNEAKLILVGEGGVGKTSLLAALHGDTWVENRKTTYGMEVDVKSLVLKDPQTGAEITFNGWDFGGQDIYRHTHQLFFTAPAIYLALWEPRRGSQDSRVREWIKMVKNRAYDESRPDLRPRVLVVATHGGPRERVAHIDEQALRDEFGDMIAGFYHVDSKPDEKGVYYQLDQLKDAIAHEAASIASVGRSVPLTWKNIIAAIRKRSEREPYISYSQYEALCNRQRVSNNLANLYTIILNELGYIIHYRDEETLKDTVILKPDYLSKAVSLILEDKQTKDANGLIEHKRLNQIWDDPSRPAQERYPSKLHPIFLKLMERFDLSYQVTLPEAEAQPTSLMSQLVPGVRPEGWEDDWILKQGDVERTQVCRIVDAQTGRTQEVEGLMYRLIVRLHRYSLGRKDYGKSRHWKAGLILDDGYNGRAFIEDIGGDVYVTVRAAYPERFLSHLCSEIEWLVDNFWKGLDAKFFVPCPTDQCKGLLEIAEMMAFKREGMPKVRCSICNKFHEIDPLMATMQPKPIWDDAVKELRDGQKQILQAQDIGFDRLSTQLRVLMSQADEQYENLLAWLSDPAREGPRLFSIEPVELSRFDPANWTNETFRITLWCEHAKVPLPVLNGKDSKKGVYDVSLTREWFKKAAPVLKFITTTAGVILPVASAGLKLVMDETIYKQLDFSKEVINASLTGISKSMDELTQSERANLQRDFRVDEAMLRELHAFLQKEDPTFGGLQRVQNKRREFLWVHEQFVGEY